MNRTTVRSSRKSLIINLGFSLHHVEKLLYPLHRIIIAPPSFFYRLEKIFELRDHSWKDKIMLRADTWRYGRSCPLLMKRSLQHQSGLSTFGLSSATNLTSALASSRRGQAERAPTFSEVTEAVTVLGIDSPSRITEKELKTKYRELVKKHHPDAGGSEATMSKITVAYDRISRMTHREKEEFDLQRRAFRGGGGTSSSSGSGTRAYNGRSPYETSYKYTYDASSSDYNREDAQFTRAYHARNQPPRSSYAPRGPSGIKTPFSQRDLWNWVSYQAPRDIGRDIRRISPTALFIRMVLAYVAWSMLFAVMYRKYRDWRQEEGWTQAEQLARDEQREELLRVRRELAERIRMARDPNQNAARERVKELRVLEYAQRRQVELQQQELRGWPAVDPARGRIVRRPFEPVGIVYYEPMLTLEEQQQQQQLAASASSERPAVSVSAVPEPFSPQRVLWNGAAAANR